MTIHNEAEKIRQKLDEENNTTVSIALFGQPGSGKSSLINKIIGKKVAEVGVETDKTIDAASYEHNGLKFVDLPGYGTKMFPKETYAEKFKIKDFDLFLCVTSGKLHQADTDFFQELVKIGKVCIFIVNKHDELWEDGVEIDELEKRKINDIKKHVCHPVEVIFTSCRTGKGFNDLNEAIMNNITAAKKERWARGAKAYSANFLKEKKEACERYVSLSSAAAALNGINPIPGVNAAVDITIIMSLFKQIRNDYGLSDDFLSKLQTSSFPIVGNLANKITKYAAKEGILMLLKGFGGREAVKAFARYIPFIGQAIAASLGYIITSNAGSSYLNDCHKLAQEILDKKLGE